MPASDDRDPDRPAPTPGPAPHDPLAPPGTRRMVLMVVIVVGMIAVIVAGARIVSRPRALLVGDSITWIASQELSGKLQGDYRLNIDGRPGFRVDQMVDPTHEDVVGDRPDRVVVNLGTNDILQDWPVDDTMRSFDQLAASLGRACVRVVTVNEFMQSPDSAVRTRAVTLNRKLRSWAAARGYGVIDWSATVRDHQVAGQPGGPLTTDSIHPTETGTSVLTDLYRDGLDSCP